MGTFSDTDGKNRMLNTLLRGTAIGTAGVVYVKLHIGDPGSAGTANAAGETTRHQATLGAAAAGVVTSTADIDWTNVSTSETISWVSFWDAVTSGLFLGRDDLPSSKAVTAGDTFRIPSGDLTFSL